MWSLLSELYLVTGILIVIVYGSLLNNTLKETKSIVSLSSLLLVIGGILSMNNSIILSGSDIWGIEVLMSEGIIKGLVLISSGVCLMNTSPSKEKSSPLGQIALASPKRSRMSVYMSRVFTYSVLIMLCSLGVMLMLSSNDLLLIYLGIELQALGMYALASYERESAYSVESGLKYFVLGAVGSGILLIGSSIIYSELGTIKLNEIGMLYSSLDLDGILLKMGIMCVIVGILFKLGSAPFHMWLVDVYEGGGSAMIRYFGVVPKIGLVSILIKVLVSIGSVYEGIVLVSMLSILVSSLGGLYQRRIKRFLGYSGIGHVGFILMGIISSVQEENISFGLLNGVFIYVLMYMLMTWWIWEIVIREKIIYIDELGMLGRRNGAVGLGIVLIMLSMAGVPPLGGFLGKMLVVKSALGSGLYMLGIIGMLGSVISGYNYLRWIKVMYFDKASLVYSGTEVRNVEYPYVNALVSGVSLLIVSISIILCYSVI